MTTRAVRRTLAAGLTTVALLGAGCTATEPSPPTGVDGLEIPNPAPEPDDFVDVVDNPWLPMPHGTTWTYDVADEAGVHRLLVTAEPGLEVLGIATTELRQEPERRKSPLLPATDYYAQDRAGNVWWFGREGEWLAGENGAEAGLVMPAEPRLGDGFAMAAALGVDTRAEIAEFDPDGRMLQLDVHRGEVLQEERYVHGVGLREWDVPEFDTSGRLVASDLDE